MTSAAVPPDPFRRLFDYIVWLYASWQTYSDLFGHSEERIAKLNRRTGFVFRVFQDSLLEDIQLEIAKLFDRATVMGHDTLTFPRILKDMDLPVGDPKRVELEKNSEALKVKCEPIITHRHRRLAHNDKAVAMDEEVLPGVSRSMIGDAVEGIGNLYSDISLALYERAVFFDVLKVEHPVNELVRVLDAGNAKLDEEAAARRERYKREYSIDVHDDVDPPELT